MPHVRATAGNPVVLLDYGVTVTPNSFINVDTAQPLTAAALIAKTIEKLDSIAAPVRAGEPATGQVEIWNAATGLWEPGSAGGAGAWVPLAAALGAKIGQTAGKNLASARLELGGARCGLKGVVEVITTPFAGSTDIILTLPEAFWPKVETALDAVVNGASADTIKLSAAGVMLSTVALGLNNTITFDGKTFPLT